MRSSRRRQAWAGPYLEQLGAGAMPGETRGWVRDARVLALVASRESNSSGRQRTEASWFEVVDSGVRRDWRSTTRRLSGAIARIRAKVE